MMLLLFLLKDTVVALDGVACTNTRNTCVLVLSDGQYTCSCMYRYKQASVKLLLPSCVVMLGI